MARKGERDIVKFNWNQSGMPVSLVSRMGRRSAVAEFKSVLNDAQNQVMVSVDAEAMANDLVESGGREYVEMVRALSADLANARKELEAANLRYERLVANLRQRGISLDADPPPRQETPEAPVQESAPVADERDDWDTWDQRFKALLG
ncbi:MAG: hypothetical protein IJI73_03855 [Kiritimatiellae bacterium]|nr:hypothetical protein [Kiritimatiellia bacterium]